MAEQRHTIQIHLETGAVEPDKEENRYMSLKQHSKNLNEIAECATQSISPEVADTFKSLQAGIAFLNSSVAPMLNQCAMSIVQAYRALRDMLTKQQKEKSENEAAARNELTRFNQGNETDLCHCPQ